MNSESNLIEKVGCDSCGSSDANAIYDDGHSHCFSCGVTKKSDEDFVTPQPVRSKALNLVEGEEITRTIRGITPATFKFWKYQEGTMSGGERVHIANHYKDGKKIGQKLRFKSKDFKVKGKMDSLYGRWLWKKGQGKKIVITEGELDALSMSQAQGNKWAVVSVPNGANGAVKAVRDSIDYLESFEEVILMFDMDEPGRLAAIEVAQLFKPKKCKIATLPDDFKDANEMILAGKYKELLQAMWNAEEYRPDGIVTLDDCEDDVIKPAEWGYSYPWESLTEITYGRRVHESFYIGAGTGTGKTTFVLELINHDVQELNLRTGVIPLEQTPKKFFQRLAGVIGNRKFHKPTDGSWDSDTLKAALAEMKRENLFVYDSKGSTDWDDVQAMIRYLVVSLECTSIYLDNLTGLRGRQGETQMAFMDRVTADIASLVLEFPIMLTVVSHLATPENGSHEEGARVKLREFKGSRSIGAWAHNAIGLERNQQDEDMKDVTTVRFLKDREMGEAGGKTTKLRYDHSIGRMVEYIEDDVDVFDDSEDEF